MCNYINIDEPEDLALWCSFLVAFYCLFRKANVAPKSLSGFDPVKEFSRKKLKLLEAEKVVLVYNNWSKTNQFMNRDVVIPMCSNSTRALDPVFHLGKLLSWDIDECMPAFSFVKDRKVSFISYDKFTIRLKSLLDRAGYSPSLYSGHSMRRGGCSLLFQLGCSPLILQAIGEFLFWVCKFNFRPIVSKIGTKQNYIADFISRNYNLNDATDFFAKNELSNMKCIVIDDNYFCLHADW